MQFTITIPDVLPQETVDTMLKQFEQQLQAEVDLARKSAVNLSKSSDAVIQAQQNLTEVDHELNHSTAEIKQETDEVKVKATIVQIDYLRKQERLQKFFNYLNRSTK